MRNVSFETLLRASKFSRFDPKIPQLFTYESGRGDFKNFGMKRDVPKKFYGSPLTHIKVRNMDGPYGQMVLCDGEEEAKVSKVIAELARLATGPSHSFSLHSIANGTLKQSSFSQVRTVPCFFPESMLVPGRLLGRIKSFQKNNDDSGRSSRRASEDRGYAIGVAGIVAHLPRAEIPTFCDFNDSQISVHKTFYFRVVSATFKDDGKPDVILSLRPI